MSTPLTALCNVIDGLQRLFDLLHIGPSSPSSCVFALPDLFLSRLWYVLYFFIWILWWEGFELWHLLFPLHFLSQTFVLKCFLECTQLFGCSKSFCCLLLCYTMSSGRQRQRAWNEKWGLSPSFLQGSAVFSNSTTSYTFTVMW